MGKLITTFSSVEAFADSCSNEYSAIFSRANETLSRVEKLYYEVQSDAERLSQQIVRGKQMLDEIQLKVDKYQALMEDAVAEVDRCNEEIYYILSHPKLVTYTDEDGNDYTVEEIDEVALAAAERARDQAQTIYEQYRDKYDEATSVMYEVSATVNRFEQIKNGIDAVAQSMQADVFEIKKYINAIENESEYNLQTLQEAIDSIAAYLASKPIHMPVGTTFDYSAGGGSTAYSSSSSSTGKMVLDEVAGTMPGDSSSSVSWSDEIKSRIATVEQLEIYQNAGLHEGYVNDRPCLMKNIDMDYIDEKTGLTNRERMARGLSPVDADSGEKIELHHIGQDFNSPFAELKADSEHGDGNHKILHPSQKTSWRQDPSMVLSYQKQKKEYWRTRSLF
ncbi:MAG: hypothetical protein K2L07_13365 [Lachnospiraceae bacterium]|nr:hypothetical protein [Lachnospiraceae bacterium]